MNIKDHGGDMKAKPRRISMTDEQDFELKLMTAAAGVSRATLINQMVRALSARLQAVRREVGLPADRAVIVSGLIQRILLRDMGILTEKEYKREIENLKSCKDDVEW